MPDANQPKPAEEDRPLTIRRLQEIEEAEARGEVVELSPRHQAERESLQKAFSRFNHNVMAQINPSLSKALSGGPVEDMLQRVRGQADQQRKAMESITRHGEEQREALKEASEDMQRVAEAKAQREREKQEREMVRTDALRTLAEQAKSQTSMNWALLIVGGLTLLATIAALIVGIISLS